MRVRRLAEWLLFREIPPTIETAGGRTVAIGRPKRVWRQIPFILVRHPVVSTVLALVVFLSVLSLVHHWPQVFQRLGAVVIGCGVFFEYTATAKRRVLVQDQVRQLLAEHMNVQARTYAQSIPSAVASMEQRGTYSAPNLPVPVRSLSEFETQETRAFIRVEMVMIGLGTVQAAIGDWISNFFYCGALQCT